MNHHTTIHEVGKGCIQAGLLMRLAQCGVRRGQKGPARWTPQHAADACDLYQWEMSLR
jgi:hypothetical protein